jgi:hypothetical protein
MESEHGLLCNKWLLLYGARTADFSTLYHQLASGTRFYNYKFRQSSIYCSKIFIFHICWTVKCIAVATDMWILILLVYGKL